MNFKLSNSNLPFAITADELTIVHGALQSLNETLLRHLVDLNASDRRALPKMGARSVDFVGKTLGYARANPQMKPAFVDHDQFEADWEFLATLRVVQQSLNHLQDMTNDTVLLVGSRAYAAARAWYKGFQAAADLEQPGAALIVDDLAARFSSQGRASKPVPPTSPATGASAP